MHYVHLIYSSDNILQYYQNQKPRIVCIEEMLHYPLLQYWQQIATLMFKILKPRVICTVREAMGFSVIKENPIQGVTIICCYASSTPPEDRIMFI